MVIGATQNFGTLAAFQTNEYLGSQGAGCSEPITSSLPCTAATFLTMLETGIYPLGQSSPLRSQYIEVFHANASAFQSDILQAHLELIPSGVVPQIGSGGIVNNASYGLISSSVAPGSIAAIFGNNLTDGTSCVAPSCNPTFGSNGRLNNTMAGVQATVNGQPAPIFYALPSQLGIQIPFEVTGTSATLALVVSGKASTSATVSLSPVSPGIFTLAATGQGVGAITHVNGSPVTTQNPAQRGELVIVYATGLGQVTPAVPTGALPMGASTTIAPVIVTIGGISVMPDYAGVAGCCAGLDQINVHIPTGLNPGSSCSSCLKHRRHII